MAQRSKLRMTQLTMVSENGEKVREYFYILLGPVLNQIQSKHR